MFVSLRRTIIADLINNRIDGQYRSQSENAIRDRIPVDFNTETQTTLNVIDLLNCPITNCRIKNCPITTWRSEN